MSVFAQPDPVSEDSAESLAETLLMEQQVAEQAEREYQRMRARERAQQRLREQRSSELFVEPPTYPHVAAMREAFQNVEHPMVIHGGLLGVGDLVTLTGQAKRGKTTVVYNLLKCLSEGSNFLGDSEYAVNRPYNVCVFDGEMPPELWVNSFYLLEPQNPERIMCIPFRGYTLDLCTDFGTQYAIRKLSEFGAEVWIVDNFSKFSHSIESTNDDVQVNQFHQNLQTVMEQVPTMLATILIHHAGHSENRARGSSAFRDRPDVLWDLNKSDPLGMVVNGRHRPDFMVNMVWDQETNLLSSYDTVVSSGDTNPIVSMKDRMELRTVTDRKVKRDALLGLVSGPYSSRVLLFDELVSEGRLSVVREGRAKWVVPGPLHGGPESDTTEPKPAQETKHTRALASLYNQIRDAGPEGLRKSDLTRNGRNQKRAQSIEELASDGWVRFRSDPPHGTIYVVANTEQEG